MACILGNIGQPPPHRVIGRNAHNAKAEKPWLGTQPAPPVPWQIPHPQIYLGEILSASSLYRLVFLVIIPWTECWNSRNMAFLLPWMLQVTLGGTKHMEGRVCVFFANSTPFYGRDLVVQEEGGPRATPQLRRAGSL